MFTRMAVALLSAMVFASSVGAQRVTVRKSSVIPVSEVKKGFDYARCAVSYTSPKSHERVRMPQSAQFRLVVANELPLGCVETTARVIGRDLVLMEEILLPGQDVAISVDPNAWDWNRAVTGAEIGSVAGAILGALSSGNGGRLKRSGRGAAAGAIIGAVAGGAPQNRRGQGDIVQVTTRVLDETGETLATQCREYRVQQGSRRYESHIVVVDSRSTERRTAQGCRGW